MDEAFGISRTLRSRTGGIAGSISTQTYIIIELDSQRHLYPHTHSCFVSLLDTKKGCRHTCSSAMSFDSPLTPTSKSAWTILMPPERKQPHSFADTSAWISFLRMIPWRCSLTGTHKLLALSSWDVHLVSHAFAA